MIKKFVDKLVKFVHYGIIGRVLDFLYMRQENGMPEKAGISSPWVIYANKLAALFDKDDEVAVDFDNEEKKVTVYVDNTVKADAIGQILPTEVQFGNVTVTIVVVPANSDVSEQQLFRQAFESNPVFSGVLVGTTPMGGEVAFALFEPEVVQFFSDDIQSPYGLTTTTYESLARDVFGSKAGIGISSSVVGEPLA